MRRLAVSLFAMFIVVPAVLRITTPESVNAAGTIRWVGPNQQYATIQDAVDDAAAGDRILVYPDTYEESVAITKDSLRIIALGQGVIVDPPDEIQACFEVNANYITIRGFQLTGTDCAAAIDFEGSHNAFEHNIIYGLTCPGVNALACRDDDGGSDCNTIANNIVTGADLGIVIVCDADDAVNTGNIVRDNVVYGVGVVGIVISNGNANEIMGNLIFGVPFGLGISIIAGNDIAQGNHRIINNVITECSDSGIALWANDSATLTGNLVFANEISHVGIDGIYLYSDPDATLSNNKIVANTSHDNGASGICLDAGSNNNKISANHALTNGDYGILVIGDNNNIVRNVALTNGMLDLCNSGTGNKWVANEYGTANWESVD